MFHGTVFKRHNTTNTQKNNKKTIATIKKTATPLSLLVNKLLKPAEFTFFSADWNAQLNTKRFMFMHHDYLL